MGELNQTHVSLRGRRALVTGAAVRLGRSIATGLASRGVDVAIHYRNSRTEAERLRDELESEWKVSVSTFPADLSDPAAAVKLAHRVESEFGAVDILVLSASSYPREKIEDIAIDSFESTLRTNLLSPFFLAKELGSRMQERGHGSVVSLLDWSIGRPDPNYLPYQISKAGLQEATLGLARALAPQVRVNGIAPGAVLLPEDTPEERQTRIISQTALKKLGSPADIVAACLYLLESDGFLSGTILKVDGGRSLL